MPPGVPSTWQRTPPRVSSSGGLSGQKARARAAPSAGGGAEQEHAGQVAGRLAAGARDRAAGLLFDGLELRPGGRIGQGFGAFKPDPAVGRADLLVLGDLGSDLDAGVRGGVVDGAQEAVQGRVWTPADRCLR